MPYLRFKEGRLFVGFRLRDWSMVWYEPIGAGDEDGTAPIGLYSTVTGLRTREPIEAEVSWLPHFEPSTFAAKGKRERERLQKQFIYDTFQCMSEKDEIKFVELKEKLFQPGYTRWTEWFEIIQNKKRQRRKRRQRREAVLTDSGLGVEHGDYINSDTSDSEDLDPRFQRPSGPRPNGPRPSGLAAITNRKRGAASGAAGSRIKKRRGASQTHELNNHNDDQRAESEFDLDEAIDNSMPADPENTVPTDGLFDLSHVGGIGGINGNNGNPFQEDDGA